MAKPRGKKVAKKTTAQSAAPMPPLVPQPHGGALKAGGTPGNRGGTGRPPDEFRRRMAELADLVAQEKYAGAIARNPDHPHWLGAAKWFADRGYGAVPNAGGTAGAGGVTIVFNFTDEGQRYEPPVVVVNGNGTNGRHDHG